MKHDSRHAIKKRIIPLFHININSLDEVSWRGNKMKDYKWIEKNVSSKLGRLRSQRSNNIPLETTPNP